MANGTFRVDDLYAVTWEIRVSRYVTDEKRPLLGTRVVSVKRGTTSFVEIRIHE